MMIDHGKLQQIDAQIIESEGRDPLFIRLLSMRFLLFAIRLVRFNLHCQWNWEEKRNDTIFLCFRMDFGIWCEKKNVRMSFFFLFG